MTVTCLFGLRILQDAITFSEQREELQTFITRCATESTLQGFPRLSWLGNENNTRRILTFPRWLWVGGKQGKQKSPQSRHFPAKLAGVLFVLAAKKRTAKSPVSYLCTGTIGPLEKGRKSS